MSRLQAPCKFCSVGSGVYTCPRCNASYCSTNCYKDRQHERCSEKFFQEWVLSSLRDMKEPNDKSKMLEILKKVAKEDLDEEETTSLEVRFADLDLNSDVDDKLIWERLTEDEREKFKTLLKNEDELSNILPAVQPWWISSTVEYVKEKDSDSDDDDDGVHLPPFPVEIKQLAQLTSKVPSECVRYNVINVLYVYVFLFRFHHGDLRELLEDVVDSVLHLSPVLSEKKNYLSLEECVQDSIRLATGAFGNLPVPVAKSLWHDVCSIVRGPENGSSSSYVLRALNDVRLLLFEFNKLCKASCDKSLKSSKKAVILAGKKLDFFICWVHEYFESSLQSLACELELMFLPEAVDDSCKERCSRFCDDRAQSAKVLIKELD